MIPWFRIGRLTRIQCLRNTSQLLLSTSSKIIVASLEYRLVSEFLCLSKRNLVRTSFHGVLYTAKSLSTTNEDSDSETDLFDVTPEETVDPYADGEATNNSESLRNALYPLSEDPIISQLNKCSSVQEVLDLIQEHHQRMNGCHASQAVLVLWDIQRCFYDVYTSHGENDQDNLISESFLENYTRQINKHKDFRLLVDLVDKSATSLSPDELSCTLLYLNRMGVDMRHHVMQKLALLCDALVTSDRAFFTMTALSRYTVAVFSQQGLWPFFFIRNALPLILGKIETCNSGRDFRLLTICLSSIRRLIGEDTLIAYKRQAEHLLAEGALDTHVVVKIATFLNHPYWAQLNVSTLRKLLLSLCGDVDELSVRDLVSVHKVLLGLLEPAALFKEVQNSAERRLADTELAMPIEADLLASLVCHSSPSRMRAFEELAQRHMSSCTSINMQAVFKILRHLKTSDVELCDRFWMATLQQLVSNPAEREDYKLLRVCHRYMYFNNNLGGTYRNYKFERQMIAWLWEQVDDGMVGLIPSNLCRAAAFILAYGNIGQQEYNPIPGQLVERVTGMTDQLGAVDCLNLSRGLQVASQMQRRGPSALFVNRFLALQSTLNERTAQLLRTAQTRPSDPNVLLRAYISRNGTFDGDLFEQLVSRCEMLDMSMSSRLLRDVSVNLLSSSCLVPGILDQMVRYITDNSSHLLGETVKKVLHTCYSLGYQPRMAPEWLQAASDVIVRDKEQIHSLALLQASLALCYFRAFPAELSHYIFTVSFLERLDDEMFRCYGKATYPARVRNHMMQLNRAVCLDCPELDVPWFHEKYCQELLSEEPRGLSPLHSDVYRALVSVLGSHDLVSTHVSCPYGYSVDFQVLLDAQQKPVRANRSSDGRLTKVAVIVHPNSDLCHHVPQLKGMHQLKYRHLEMLGYRIVGVRSRQWNSMYMAEPEAKLNYLRDQLWPASDQT